MQIVGTERQINKTVLLENPLRHLRLLHHAAAHANDQLRLVLLQFLEPGDISQCPAFGIITHAAGIEQHQIRFPAICRLGHAHFQKHAGQLFTVMRIHLASICDNMKALRPFIQFQNALDGVFLLDALGFRNINRFVLHV